MLLKKANLIAISFLQVACILCNHKVKAGCPVTDNPSQMFQCLTINPQAFIDLISKGDYKSFCHMANGYMTCMTTYVRDCLGGKAATGILEELQDLNLKCCISGRTQDCILKNPRLLQRCFAADNKLLMSTGDEKSIIDARVGDRVKSIDSNGRLIDTEIVSILHKNNNMTVLFPTFYDESGSKQISLSHSHLIYVKNAKNYKKASEVRVGDTLVFYGSNSNNDDDYKKQLDEFKVARINYELKHGYIAPLTNEGTILVNRVLSSCYAEINSHQIADMAMTPIKLWYKISMLWKRVENTKSEPSTTSVSAKADYIDVDFYSAALYKFASKFMPSIFV